MITTLAWLIEKSHKTGSVRVSTQILEKILAEVVKLMEKVNDR